MTELTVKGLPPGDAGRQLVRLNHKHRAGVARYGIVKLTNHANSNTIHVLVLGHDEDTAIFMPYDIRTKLDVEKEGKLDFEIRSVGLVGKFYWYVSADDPAIYLPAWIAVVGLGLSVIGLALGLAPFLCE